MIAVIFALVFSVTRYLTTEEIAEQLHCSRRTISALVSAGRIPYRRVRGVRRTFFVPDEIEAWINGADLETVNSNGGKIVRPKVSA